MSDGGLAASRLNRMREVMAGHVERGNVPGFVTLVSRRGEVHVDAIGAMAVGGNSPMRRDTIFRMSSMAKPVAAVAAMMLVEECKLRLDDPVDELLPELADRRVLKRLDGPLDDTVPANRPITLRDVLTFRLGYGIVLRPPDTYPIQRAISELEIVGFGAPHPASPHDPDEWMSRLGTLPLLHQPGEEWTPNTGSAVLGVLIARAAAQPLETFLCKRIFEPLAMVDTSFSVPREKLHRLASSYEVNSGSGALDLFDGVDDSQWCSPPAFPDAAGGLVSTVDDYLAFGQMLLNGGRHGNERILSRLSVEVMTTDQLLPEQRPSSDMILGSNRGWGFGVSIVTLRDDVSAVPGRFGWDGGLGTSWASDPTEQLVAILMTQSMAFPDGIYSDFWTSVYQAIGD